MAHPEMASSWEMGKLMSVADRGKFLLVEMPHRMFVDLRDMVRRFRAKGVRIILAHPERQPEFLHDPGVIEALIKERCLVQVSSASVAEPDRATDERALKSWCKRGCVHLIGSDGHSPDKRPPRLAAAYHRISRWVGAANADRICGSNGVAVLRGLPLLVSPPQPKRSWWAPRL
jgi:protein-tyrosine phosphatase